MNRRIFVNGIGLTILTRLGMATAFAASALPSGPTASALAKKNKSGAAKKGDDSPAEIKKRTRGLLVFMIGATQSPLIEGSANRKYRIEELFPAGRTATKDEIKQSHFAELGLDKDFLVDFVTGMDAAAAKQLHDHAKALSEVFYGLFSYGKPDCPNVKVLQDLIKVAESLPNQ